MEKVKDPATMVGVSNVVASFMIGMYFYSKCGTLEERVGNLEKNQQEIVRQMNEINNTGKLNNEAIGAIKSSSAGFRESMQDDIQEIVNTLSEKDIRVELPSGSRRRKGSKETSKKSKKQKHPVVSSSSSSSEEDSEQTSRNIARARGNR